MSKKDKQNLDLHKPWITMAAGVKTMIVVTVVLIGLVAYQAIPILGWLQGSLTAVAFAGSIWVVFYGNLLFQRFIRGNPGSKD
jgi:hypothetical protein